MSGSPGTVTALAFSPAGDRLVSGDQYGNLRMWLPDKGTPIGQTFGNNSSAVSNLALSPDGEVLASADVLGTVGLWPATGSLADLCAKLTANMSHRQWNEWLSPDIDYIKTCPDLPLAPD
jgi:WD40 repeat protein